MSLRIFHIFFIIVSIVFLFGFGVREARIYEQTKAVSELLYSAGSFALAALMTAYLRWFVTRKIKAAGR